MYTILNKNISNFYLFFYHFPLYFFRKLCYNKDRKQPDNRFLERVESMNIIYTSRKCTVKESLKDFTEKKLKKLDKFFTSDCTVSVLFTLEKENLCRTEITTEYKGIIFRAQQTTEDFKTSVDCCVDMLIRQIRKHKTKLEKRLKDSSFSFGEIYEKTPEEETKIVRKKAVAVKPMSEEEAILQMNMLGHDFYIFREDTDEKLKVIYRRKDGGYGILEPDII